MFHRENDESRSITAQSFFGDDFEYSTAISEDCSLRISAVFACVKAIAETISTLPLHLFRSPDGPGGSNRERAKDHYLSGFLADAPNDSMTWIEARQALATGQVLRGNSHADVTWRGGMVRQIDPLCNAIVTPMKTKAGRMAYDVQEPDKKARRIMAPNIAHFKGLTLDGLQGLSPISVCRYAMKGAQALNEHGQNQIENGARLTGALKMPNTFKNKEVRDRVRESWERIHSGPKGRRVAILENGLEWQQISMSLQDAQFIEQMQFSVEEIARIFSVPPHVIGHLLRSTNNNIEHQGKEFYQRTILPWLIRINQTLNRTLLTQDERRAGYYFEHNPDGILSADFKTRTEGIKNQVFSGTLTINEARALENRPPVEGGDIALVPLNHVPLSMFGDEQIQQVISELAKKTKSPNSEKNEDEDPE